jgi:crossover junction endodeoxyribonuclease RusA
VTLKLPYPPTTNHAYTVARGRKIKTAVARQYAAHVHYAVADERRVDPDGWYPTTTDRLRVVVHVHPPDNRKRDLANTEKLALDAVCSALGVDDSQIDQLTLVRGVTLKSDPHLLLTLRPA